MLLLVMGCAPNSPTDAAEVTAVPLFDDGEPAPARVGTLDLVGAYELRSPDPDFGGISAARRDGSRVLLLSDRSRLFELRWPRHAADRPFTMAVLGELPLAVDGRPLDAEALVLTPDRDLVVGDEEKARLVTFERALGTATQRPVSLPGLFRDHRATNEGIETLARLPDGSLIAIAEGAWEDKGLHTLLRLSEDGPQFLHYRAGDGYEPTDADVAGDWLFVLERRLSFLQGWQSRITVVPLADLGDPPDGIVAPRELATVTGPVLGENYEGLSAQEMQDGSLDLVLVSDDNFNGIQRTQLLEFRWRA
jgi:hypothetical protein